MQQIEPTRFVGRRFPDRLRAGAIVALLLSFAPLAIAASTPDAASSFTRDDAAHLLRRAGFGGTPEQIDRLQPLGRDGAIAYLLDGKLPDGAKPVFATVALDDFVPAPREELFPRPDPLVQQKLREAQVARREAEAKIARGEQPTTLPATLMKEAEELRRIMQRSGQRNAGTELERLRVWWIDRMVRTDRPAEEKITLFWHGLFTSGVREVRDPIAMAEQNILFHKHAMGNYKELTHAIVHDAAMLRYLDNDKNVVGKPNENLARELMELFTMGEGQGYTEQDIKEVARALTGLSPNGDGRRPGGGGGPYGDGKVTMRARLHDTGQKTIFGKTGNFGPDDVVDLIFDRPEPAKYLAKRLWEFYAYSNPSEADVQPVAEALRSSGYELKPALRAIFASSAFYGERAKFALIKSPTELTVSTVRLLSAEPNDGGIRMLGQRIRSMDQELLQPPNVRGWVGGENWITAATLFVRYNTMTSLVNGALRGGNTGRDGMRPGGPGGGQGGPFAEVMNVPAVQIASAKARATRTRVQELTEKAQAADGDEQAALRKQLDAAREAAREADLAVRTTARAAREKQTSAQEKTDAAKAEPQRASAKSPQTQPATKPTRTAVEVATVAKLFPSLPADAKPAQVVDAAVARFLQRPLHPDKRQALIDTLSDAPLKLGEQSTDVRVKQMVSLLLSSPEYQVQ